VGKSGGWGEGQSVGDGLWVGRRTVLGTMMGEDGEAAEDMARSAACTRTRRTFDYKRRYLPLEGRPTSALF
jgi:hypothetical protein